MLENESDRVIIISPIWSGYREENSQNVIFDTSYQYKEENEFRFEVMLPLKIITSIAKFDQDLHEYFISIGKTKLQPKMEEPVLGLEPES